MWVTILSVLIFKEDLNALKTLGLTIVVAGVAVLGRRQRVTTPLSSIGLVLFASFIGSFGAVFLKSGATRLKGIWLP